MVDLFERTQRWLRERMSGGETASRGKRLTHSETPEERAERNRLEGKRFSEKRRREKAARASRRRNR